MVGEELSEPILEARLDVMLDVKLDARGFTGENTVFCVCREQKKKGLIVTLLMPFDVKLVRTPSKHKPVYLGPLIFYPYVLCS